MSVTRTDGELVRSALRGDRTARDALVNRWSARVLAVCHARVARRDVAEELAQESLLRGMRSLDTLAEPEKFGPWLSGIAARVCHDWRKQKQSSQVPFTALGADGWSDELATATSDSPDASAERADELARLMSEVESLAESHREVLMLFYYQEMTYQAMADLLGVSTATINARLTQARAILRERLSSERR